MPELFPFGGFDLVRAQKGAIDALDEIWCAIAGIEALVGIDVAGCVSVGGHLPAAAVNGLQPALHHFDGLVAGDGAERGNVRIGVHQIPEPLGAKARERVLDLDGAAQAEHIGIRVRAL